MMVMMVTARDDGASDDGAYDDADADGDTDHDHANNVGALATRSLQASKPLQV